MDRVVVARAVEEVIFEEVALPWAQAELALEGAQGELLEPEAPAPGALQG